MTISNSDFATNSQLIMLTFAYHFINSTTKYLSTCDVTIAATFDGGYSEYHYADTTATFYDSFVLVATNSLPGDYEFSVGDQALFCTVDIYANDYSNTHWACHEAVINYYVDYDEFDFDVKNNLNVISGPVQGDGSDGYHFSMGKLRLGPDQFSVLWNSTLNKNKHFFALGFDNYWDETQRTAESWFYNGFEDSDYSENYDFED